MIVVDPINLSLVDNEMMMMSWSLTTHQPFWVISVIKVR